MAEQQTIYVPSTFGNVFTFEGGAEVYNVDIVDLKAFGEFVKEHKTEDGKLRLQIRKQKNDPKKLSVTLNTYKSKTKVEEERDDFPF